MWAGGVILLTAVPSELSVIGVPTEIPLVNRSDFEINTDKNLPPAPKRNRGGQMSSPL